MTQPEPLHQCGRTIVHDRHDTDEGWCPGLYASDVRTPDTMAARAAAAQPPLDHAQTERLLTAIRAPQGEDARVMPWTAQPDGLGLGEWEVIYRPTVGVCAGDDTAVASCLQQQDAEHVMAMHNASLTVAPTGYIDVVMTKLPGPDGEFVETEDDTGRGVGSNRGLGWVDLGDGFHRLRIPAAAFAVQRPSTEAVPAAESPCIECGDHRGWTVAPDFTTGEAEQVQCRTCTEHVCPPPGL